MPQERHAQLSRLVDRSLRASMVLVALLTLAGVATTVVLRTMEGRVTRGQELLLTAEGLTGDTQAMRLSMAMWVLEGNSTGRAAWRAADESARRRIDDLGTQSQNDVVAGTLATRVAARLEERERAAAPLLDLTNTGSGRDARIGLIMGRDYQAGNTALSDAIGALAAHERDHVTGLHHHEDLVLLIAALVLVALVGWSVPTLRRARRTARQLLANLDHAIGALEVGRAELQAFTDAAPLGVFHVDTAGTPKWLNAQASAWAGTGDGAAFADAMRAAVHPEDRSRVVSAWGTLVSRGDRFEEVFRFTAPDGQLLWAQAHAAPVLVDGATTGFVAVMQDVTDARVLQDEVIRSRRRMRRLTDSVPALLARLDANETYRFVNATYSLWFGDRAPTSGTTLREFLGDDAHAQLKPAFDRVRTGQAVHFEMSHENLHGRSFVGDITYTPDLDEDGRFCGFYVMATDISERKRLEENLFAAKELAQVTLDSIGHAVVTTDNAGIVTSLNHQAEAMLQRPASRARGLPIDSVVHLTDAAGFPAETALLHAIEERRLVDRLEPRRLMHADGTHAVIEDVAAPIRDRAGHVVGGVLVLRDVSVTQALADRMRKLAEADALTGLSNRLVFDERLRTALGHLGPMERCAVLYMDLDGFKTINDTYGHAAGDAVLCEVARRFSRTAGTTDTVCRLGGDEFVVLLPPPVSLREAVALAARFVEATRAPVPWSGHTLEVTLSVGVAIAPDDGSEALALMRRADGALYIAKAAGKNQVSLAGDLRTMCSST
jgi:diguanylate cyclase (GGDEF)-like protein/PAS domain S-box-containing protein